MKDRIFGELVRHAMCHSWVRKVRGTLSDMGSGDDPKQDKQEAPTASPDDQLVQKQPEIARRQTEGAGGRPEELAGLEKTAPTIPLALQTSKLQAEIAKLKVETENLRRQSRSEDLRFWIPIVAPLVGSVALVATLLFQVIQFNENARMNRQAAEATQFREALQNAQSNAPSSAKAVASMIRLASFLNSKEHGSDTRHAMIPLLVGLAIPGQFKELHSRMFPRIEYSDLPDVVQVSRIQYEIADEGLDRANNLQKQLDQAKADVIRKAPGAEARVSNIQHQFDSAEESLSRVSGEIRTVSEDIASALRKRPVAESPDLSFTHIYDADFSGVDFGPSDMTGTRFDQCDVTGSDLSKVVAFEGSEWNRVQWWTAKAISPKLLDHLRGEYAFKPEVAYRGPNVTQADYDNRLAALGWK